MEHILQLQRTAGNRAVTAVIQRAPGDEDEGPTSYAAVSMPAVSMGPRPAGSGQAGSDADDPAAMLPDPDVIVPVGGKHVAPPTPKPVPPGFGGGVDPSGRTVLTVAPHAVPDANVRRQYRQDPSSVFRSPSADWHQEMWLQMKLPDQPDEAPVAFAAGPLVAVHPRYPGPATGIPSSYKGDDQTGLGAPQAPTETPLDHTAPAPGRPMMNAVVPSIDGRRAYRPGPQGPGRQTAIPASTVDIVNAMKANPNSVKRAPNQQFYDQMYELDFGLKGSTTPTAFRVGNQILVSPNHPITGVETLAIPGGGTQASGGAPGAAGVPAGPGHLGTPAAPAAAGSGTGRRRKGDVNVTKDSPGVKGEYMWNDESTENDATTKKGKGATGSVGGGNVASVGGQQVESTTTGDATTANKKAANLTLKPDGSIVLGSEKSRATFKGTGDDGQPIKTGETKTNKNLGLSEKGLTGGAGAERETAGGHKVGAQGSITIDGKGNASIEGSLKFESRGGTSLTPSVSGSTTVEATDPTPAEGGGFDVTFTVTDSSGAAISGGKQFGGGPSASIQIGTSSGTMQTGTKHFDTEETAKAFRDNAARFIAAEAFLARPPVNTVEGALAIPPGEERGTGDIEGSNWGVSGSLEGATVSYGSSKSTTHQFRVRHTHDKVVQVTGGVVGTKASEVGLSGGIALGRGGSNSHGFEVVWEIDLADRAGRNAFEMYAKAGLPPVGAKLISMTSSGSDEDHDSVSIPLLGTAKWTGTTWEIIREDASGRHAQFGGKQSHDQDPSWTGKHIFGQDTIHSNSQITSRLDTDKEGNEQESYEAQITVSGTTGDETRRELGQIWSGVARAGGAKASGEWTLTATVSQEVVTALERVNKAMREAWSKEDKMRVYSALVKEHGIRMVGAQAGLGGDPLAWSVELKGDKNFPGPTGRAALDAKRADLRGKLKDAAAAKAVVGDAQKILDELQARRIAVADKERYTDLPDGLRDQQLKLIDKHISDFEFIRHQGLRAALKVEAGESKPDAAKPGAGKPDAATAGGYQGNNEAAESADMLKLRTAIDQKESAISAIDPRISRAINAVMQASGHMVNVPPVYAGWVLAHKATYDEHWNAGIDMNSRQFAMAPKIDALRQKLLDSLFAVDRKAAAEALFAQLTDRLALLETLHIHVVAAAEAIKPITNKKGVKGYPRFWGSINGDEPPWTDAGTGTLDE